MPRPESCFDVVSCWSKAGIGTSIVLEYNARNSDSSSSRDAVKVAKKKRGPRLVLDIGATPVFDEAIPANVVLISHGHVDHIGAIFSHARAHNVAKSGSTPTYYVPAPLVSSLKQARDAMSALDAANDGTGSRNSSLIAMNIVGVSPGDEIILPIRKHLNGLQLFARVFAVTHAGCPAVGYVIGSRRGPQLRDEYRGLPSEKIRQLIASGVSIKASPPDVLEVAYTGDTSLEGLMTQDDNLIVRQALECPLLFCEVTFLDDDDQSRQLSQDRGHMHIDDIGTLLRRQGRSLPPSKLVLFHLSARYGATIAMDHVVRALPPEYVSYCSVAISSLLQSSEDDSEWTTLIDSNGCIRVEDYAQFQTERK